MDVTKVGQGKLTGQLINLRTKQTCLITLNDSEKQGLYDVNFMPVDQGIHKCTLLFNKRNIKGNQSKIKKKNHQSLKIFFSLMRIILLFIKSNIYKLIY